MSELAEVLPEPPKAKRTPFFTKANAKAFALKGLEARWHSTKPAPALLQPVPVPAKANSKPSEELSLVNRQISLLRDALEKDMEPGERAQLVRALDLMLDRKRVLSDKPLPGSLRPANTKPTKGQQSLGPIEE